MRLIVDFSLLSGCYKFSLVILQRIYISMNLGNDVVFFVFIKWSFGISVILTIRFSQPLTVIGTWNTCGIKVSAQLKLRLDWINVKCIIILTIIFRIMYILMFYIVDYIYTEYSVNIRSTRFALLFTKDINSLSDFNCVLLFQSIVGCNLKIT